MRKKKKNIKRIKKRYYLIRVFICSDVSMKCTNGNIHLRNV